VSKTWRDDRSWRMDGISVLKCSPDLKAGVLWAREERRRTAGVAVKLSWLPGVEGRSGGLSMGGEWSLID
jgi:hypothetical protein